METTILEKIILAMYKASHLELFKNFTKNEKAFIDCYRASHYFEKLTIEKAADGRFVLVWNSCSELTVACIINDSGFCFDDIAIYGREDKHMQYPFKTHFFRDNVIHKKKRLEKEIEELKELFLSYSPDADVYVNKN